jgi:formylglycine-generating enzyme required for sulfatase activity
VEEAKEKGRPDWFVEKIPTEGPQHKVTLTKIFSLCIHPVTRGQFAQFVEATGYKTDAEEDGKGGYGRKDDQWVQAPEFLWHTKLGFEPEPTDAHPVVNVSWNDAVAFCKWLSREVGGTYRLPTEAEWEFACRAGNPGRFSFGDDESKLSDYAWYGGLGGLGTKPVGQKAANAFGLFDIHGNVWEWCGDGFTLYDAAAVIDPVGMNRFQLRVARGGAFSTQPSAVRSARRSDGTPTTRYIVNGFRVLLVTEPAKQPQDE